MSTIGSASVSVTIPANGYYYLSLIGLTFALGSGSYTAANTPWNLFKTGAIFGFTFILSTNNVNFRQATYSNMMTSFPNNDFLSSARSNGSSMLMSNVSQVMNVGGTILADKAPDSTIYSLTNTLTTIATNAGDEGVSAILNGATGLYTWARPTAQIEQFVNFTNEFGAPIYHLDEVYPQHVITVFPGSVDQNFKLELSCVLEFLTPNELYPKAMSRITAAQKDGYLMALKTYPTFTENPLHIKQLLQSLRKGAVDYARKAGNLAAVVAPAASLYNPAAGAALSGLAEVFRSLGV